MKTLTREEAIKRIRDINDTKSVEHLIYPVKNWMLNDCERGAVNELMAIFDIKESEL